MKKHEIDVKDLIDWKEDIEKSRMLFASHIGMGQNKKLYATLSGGFQVEHHGEIVFVCMQPFQAVEKYNSL